MTAPLLFSAELWVAHSMDSWVFVTLPQEASESVRDSVTTPPRGFGSVRVEVTLGETTWRTSVFPEAASGCFVLPVKKAVRRAEGVDPGDVAEFAVRVVEA
jgi:hypothetical protein